MAEQLMDTLSNEEHERLLLMSEHAIAPPLSPAAQAVLNAATEGFWSSSLSSEGNGAAAVLRAVANQVVPEQLAEPHGTGFRWGGWAAKQGVRRKLLAIADELEGL
jgi:hypothetical protein